MAGSVAGQIRIDLLTNAAQFKAGMREAGRDGFGGFQQEAEKFSRGGGSQKAIAESIQKEKDAWRTAMKSLREDVKQYSGFDPRGNSRDMLSWYGMEGSNRTGDQGLRNQTRWKSMLPFGMTMRTELSREAALTAAAIGDGKQKIVKSLSSAMGEIGMATANAGGFGGLAGTVGKFAMGHPLVTGLGLAGGFMAKQVHDRDVLAGETKAASRTLGQGSEDTSRLMASGFDQPTLSKFQKSLSDQSPEQMEAFGKLKLDPDKLGTEPLLQSLLKVRDAMDSNVKNPADRASVAMHLFGKGGATMIATLDEMKEKLDLVGDHDIIKPQDIERVEAWEHALKGASNTFSDLSLAVGKKLGSESGFGTQIARGVEAMKHIATWDWEGFDNTERRWKKEDYNVTHADEIEKAKTEQAKLANEGERYAAAMQKAKDQLQSLRDEISDVGLTGDEKALSKFSRQLDKDKIVGPERDSLMSEFAGAQNKKRQSEFDTKFDDDRRQAAEERDSTAMSLAEKYKTPKEQRESELGKIEHYLGKDSETYGRANARFRDEDRSRLGIKDPIGDFGKGYAELSDARDRGIINKREFGKRAGELGDRMLAGIAGEKPSINLNGAMAAGSREAHSVISSNMAADPTAKAVVEGNKILTQLNKGQMELTAAMHHLVTLMGK